MYDRWNEPNQFIVTAPLCKICKNYTQLEFNPEEPDRILLACKIYGDAPEKIAQGDEYVCQAFQLDKEKLEMFKPFLPEEVVARYTDK